MLELISSLATAAAPIVTVVLFTWQRRVDEERRRADEKRHADELLAEREHLRLREQRGDLARALRELMLELSLARSAALEFLAIAVLKNESHGFGAVTEAQSRLNEKVAAARAAIASWSLWLTPELELRFTQFVDACEAADRKKAEATRQAIDDAFRECRRVARTSLELPTEDLESIFEQIGSGGGGEAPAPSEPALLVPKVPVRTR